MNHITFDFNIKNDLNIQITLESNKEKGNEFSREEKFLKLHILNEKDYYNNKLNFEYLGGHIVANLLHYSGEFTLDLRNYDADEAAFIINGIYLRSWTFDEFKNKKKEKIQKLNIKVDDKNLENIKKIFYEDLKKQSDGVLWAQRISNMPPNIIYPETYVNEVKKLFFNEKNIKITILNSEEIQKKNMNLLYGVGKGSKYPPYVMIIEKGNNPTTALIGKGVTFDTGGINLKGAEGMRHMKMDKAGASSVVGAVFASKEPVMGIIGLVENMIGPDAQRIDDIIKSMNDSYVEIAHTDAEGRLILADLNSFAETFTNITEIINVATLTGAVGICLGKEYAALMSNNENLTKKLKIAGNETGDRVWELPCGPEYDYYLTERTDGDVSNLGPKGEGGTIAGGKFIQYFVKNKNIKWAHLDIAIAHQRHTPLSGKEFSNGFGVRLLSYYMSNKKCCSEKIDCCK